MSKAFLITLLLLPAIAFTQVAVTGHVIGQADTRAVANVSVFLSNTTIGDHTGTDGMFTLKNVKPGEYELVISVVGYDTYKQKIKIDQADLNLHDITIYPKSIGLAEVKVNATREKESDRARNMEWFREEFFGTSDIARLCTILNPGELYLDYDEVNGVLTGSSADYLIIENQALGYRIKYLLTSFRFNNYDSQNKSFSYAGTVFFEPMHGTEKEEREWKDMRKMIYEGSETHFLRAILENRMEKEGFQVLRIALTRNPKRQPDSVINANVNAYTLLVNNGRGKERKRNKDSLNYWIKQSKLSPYSSQKLIQLPLKQKEIAKSTAMRGVYSVSAGGDDALFVTYDKYGHFSTGAYSHLSEKNNNASVVTFSKKEALFDNNGTIINPMDVSYEGVWSRNRVASLLPVDYEPEQSITTQTDTALVAEIDSKVGRYNQQHLKEKVYLHFDKPFYAAGDTMYFKAYVTEGNAHTPSQQSGVLYAELINTRHKIDQALQLQIKEGTACGDFALPDTLKDGSYRVRAYTRLMQNDSASVLFDKTIPVASLVKQGIPESGTPVPKHGANKAAIRFLPEGGTLVAGVRSRMAFKALAEGGSGIDVKGVVLDENGKEITRFQSTHLGMGSFYITPELNKTYRAKLTYASGEEDVITIPGATAGISLSVTAQPGNYLVKLTANKAWYQEFRNRKYTLVTYSAGSPYSISCKLSSREMTLNLPKEVLHTGIAKLTLFAADGEPLCERLLFAQNEGDPQLEVVSNRKLYHPREKVNLNIKTAGMGQYSVSVTDESKVLPDSLGESTIVNNLLLTSELRGFVEQPNYYFTNISDKTRNDLDLVMLTHGYRSLVWKDVLSGNKGTNSVILSQPEKGLTISGYVKANKKPVVMARVKLFSKGANALVLDTVTDANGHFVFDRLTFGDTVKFVLQARTEKGGKDVDIVLDKPNELPVANKLTDITGAETTTGNLTVYQKNADAFAKEQRKYGINQYTLMLKDVVIKDKKRDTLTAHSQNLNGAGHADQVITAKDLETTPCVRLADCLIFKLIGVVYYKGNLYVRRLQNMTFDSLKLYDLPMAVMVDGTMMDPDVINSLRPTDVESVEVLTGPHYAAIYGSQGAGGILHITTKPARKINNYYRDASGVIVYNAKGFYKAREFYAPQYDNPKTNQKIPDLRSTIYWNPNVITDKDGKASFSYFNADGKGTYRVVIEGIDADGNLGRTVYRYNVQ